MVNNLQRLEQSKGRTLLDQKAKGKGSFHRRSEELMKEADSGSYFTWLKKKFLDQKRTCTGRTGNL